MNKSTIVKTGSMFRVVSEAGTILFSSLDRANCKRWIVASEESREEYENKFLIDEK